MLDESKSHAQPPPVPLLLYYPACLPIAHDGATPPPAFALGSIEAVQIAQRLWNSTIQTASDTRAPRAVHVYLFDTRSRRCLDFGRLRVDLFEERKRLLGNEDAVCVSARLFQRDPPPPPPASKAAGPATFEFYEQLHASPGGTLSPLECVDTLQKRLRLLLGVSETGHTHGLPTEEADLCQDHRSFRLLHACVHRLEAPLRRIWLRHECMLLWKRLAPSSQSVALKGRFVKMAMRLEASTSVPEAVRQRWASAFPSEPLGAWATFVWDISTYGAPVGVLQLGISESTTRDAIWLPVNHLLDGLIAAEYSRWSQTQPKPNTISAGFLAYLTSLCIPALEQMKKQQLPCRFLDVSATATLVAAPSWQKENKSVGASSAGAFPPSARRPCMHEIVNGWSSEPPIATVTLSSAGEHLDGKVSGTLADLLISRSCRDKTAGAFTATSFAGRPAPGKFDIPESDLLMFFALSKERPNGANTLQQVRTRITPMWLDFDLVTRRGFLNIGVKQPNGVSVLDVIQGVIRGSFPVSCLDTVITSASGVIHKQKKAEAAEALQESHAMQIDTDANAEADPDIVPAWAVGFALPASHAVEEKGSECAQGTAPETKEQSERGVDCKSSYALVWTHTASKRNTQQEITQRIVSELAQWFGPTVGGVSWNKVIDGGVLSSDQNGKRFVFHDKHEVQNGEWVRHKRPSLPWAYLRDVGETHQPVAKVTFKEFVMATSLRRVDDTPLPPCVILPNTVGTTVMAGTGSVDGYLPVSLQATRGDREAIPSQEMDKESAEAMMLRQILIPFLGDKIKFQKLERQWFLGRCLQYRGDFAPKTARCVHLSTPGREKVHPHNRSYFWLTDATVSLNDYSCSNDVPKRRAVKQPWENAQAREVLFASKYRQPPAAMMPAPFT